MSIHIFKMPDLGEGTVAAEVVSWRVVPGDSVEEGQPIVEMSTEKAVVEVPAPVRGIVVRIAGAAGSQVAVGAELAAFETSAAQPSQAPGIGVRASPATRRRAQAAGIDLTQVQGSGPDGRITGADLRQPAHAEGIEELRVIGVRRVIAERMSAAKRNIPHFSYVEEVDVTELEAMRARLSRATPAGQPRLSILPLVVAALVRVLKDFPQCNAHYDTARETLRRFRAVHVGIATQTPDGLKVPVVRDAQRLGLPELAAEIRRVAAAARNNQATAALLSGSTITVTSLGKLGGIASTPIINAPEMAIVGINRAQERPVVRDGVIVVRTMMNVSSSFDHRFVDGYDAAAMIQALKALLEAPADIPLSASE